MNPSIDFITLAVAYRRPDAKQKERWNNLAGPQRAAAGLCAASLEFTLKGAFIPLIYCILGMLRSDRGRRVNIAYKFHKVSSSLEILVVAAKSGRVGVHAR